ncbi:hypothetical protein C2E23DRAFT_902802 [Lenzites betulinus]|nr:hypothetical protein C2E23DRAFT_902802 [Lenzites betulinus]
MVFARMTPADKDAFFALLDELSAPLPASRHPFSPPSSPHPGHLFSASGSGGDSTANNVAAGKAAAASATSAAGGGAPSAANR